MSKRDDAEAKFGSWLLTRRGTKVTAVPGDKEWNRDVAISATDQVKGKTRK